MEAHRALNCQLSPDNLAEEMMESENKWKLIQDLMRKIMYQKEKDRNILQRQIERNIQSQ